MTVLQFACLIYGAGSGVALSVAVVAAWRLTQLDEPAPRRHRAGDTRADARQQTPALVEHADTLVLDGALVDTGEVKRHRRGAR